MPEALSKIERRILNYLVDYLRENTYQPSIREIGRRFGIKSTKTVSEHLHSLAEKGYIERDASRSRGVRILGMNLAPSVVSVPCYGRVAAGVPTLLREDVREAFDLDRKLVSSSDAFMLEVQGDSMQGLGILDGDLAIVEPVDEREIENGEVVAARVDGDATVKRYFANGGKVVLEPANTGFAPILVHEHNDFAVLGRVSGIHRRLTRSQTEAVVTGAH
jgi:repressor LexA